MSSPWPSDVKMQFLINDEMAALKKRKREGDEDETAKKLKVHGALHLETLPRLMILAICARLNGSSLIQIQQLNKFWLLLCNPGTIETRSELDDVWKAITQREFPTMKQVPQLFTQIRDMDIRDDEEYEGEVCGYHEDIDDEEDEKKETGQTQQKQDSDANEEKTEPEKVIAEKGEEKGEEKKVTFPPEIEALYAQCKGLEAMDKKLRKKMDFFSKVEPQRRRSSYLHQYIRKRGPRGLPWGRLYLHLKMKDQALLLRIFIKKATKDGILDWKDLHKMTILLEREADLTKEMAKFLKAPTEDYRDHQWKVDTRKIPPCTPEISEELHFLASTISYNAIEYSSSLEWSVENYKWDLVYAAHVECDILGKNGVSVRLTFVGESTHCYDDCEDRWMVKFDFGSSHFENKFAYTRLTVPRPPSELLDTFNNTLGGKGLINNIEIQEAFIKALGLSHITPIYLKKFVQIACIPRGSMVATTNVTFSTSYTEGKDVYSQIEWS